jgi:hypothetical protein
MQGIFFKKETGEPPGFSGPTVVVILFLKIIVNTITAGY